MIDPHLKSRLEPVARRQRRFALWCKLAACWMTAALLGLVLVNLESSLGRVSSLAMVGVLLSAIITAGVIIGRHARRNIDWQSLARKIEARYPELDGRLLTALDQEAGVRRNLSYLQERVMRETLLHAARKRWIGILPESRMWLSRLAHVGSIALLLVVLLGLRTTSGRPLLASWTDPDISVTPGDASIERGDSLVVMTRFAARVPARVELILQQNGRPDESIPLVRSLADPMFGGSVPDVDQDFTYHVEYAGRSTREFKVTVYEHPRLERSDVELTYPGYTGLEPKRIENTRRVSAVEGSRLDLALQLNKPVETALLVSQDDEKDVVPLQVEKDRPVVELAEFSLASSHTYELHLVDADGRTNKQPELFVLQALPNRPPELRIVAPRGDTRPSALEEMRFEGTVWDDFGVQAYGVAYSMNGEPEEVVQLGDGVALKEKQAFKKVMRLEEHDAQPDDLITWYLWADDIGPDGNVRRTMGDMYFAEVRPYDEIFRQGQSGAGGQGGGQQPGGGGGEGNPELDELQKQIINATWKLRREQNAADRRTHREGGPEGNSGELPKDTSTAVWPDSPASQDGDFPVLPHVPQFFGQRRGGERGGNQERPASSNQLAPSNIGSGNYQEDMRVILDAQANALEQAQAARSQAGDPTMAALWDDVVQQMETAIEKMKKAVDSPETLREAMSSQQAAFQLLSKVRQREYSVTRQRNQQNRGNQSSRQRQMQMQLDQMDLTEEENRYETERLAQAPRTPERREQLQVMNRLQELARRQQDLNERLKELQTALQEARTEEEREEVRRQLKRLQEEEQQMLADVDELRQRMDSPENQSRMTEQRQQLEQTRNEVQQAAEATRQGSVSQALAAGTRAQRQMREMREDMRREAAGEFAEDMRRMRAGARELVQQQEKIQERIDALNDSRRKTLSDSDLNRQAREELARQKELLTNLVHEATEISRQAEEAEPLMSGELYDTLRDFSQDDLDTVKQFQEELLAAGMFPLYQRLKDTAENSGAKALDLTSEMLREGYLPQANIAEERARAGINDFARGIERAANRVLGDDAEALRLARQQLERLTEQLEREIAEAGQGGTNEQAPASATPGAPGDAGQSESGQSRQQLADARQEGGREGSAQGEQQSERGGQPSGQQQPGRVAGSGDGQPDEPSQPEQQARGEGQNGGQAQSEQAGGGQGQREDQAQRGRGQQANRGNRGGRLGNNRAGGGGGGGGNDRFPLDLDQLLGGNDDTWGGPITGGDFAPWSDGLREVEELVDLPDLRNDVARARERARQFRQDYTRNQQKPDWAVVRLEVVQPLVEVRDRIAEELARRDSTRELVPIDRDPVPARYSDLVRRYYEELGKDQ